jgi:hypothetical protein
LPSAESRAESADNSYMIFARTAAVAAIAASMTFVAAAPLSAQTTVAFSKSAPADEYFGPLKMSVLGIKNTIVETSARLDNAPSDDDALRNANLVEASVREWEAKYPHDAWLPRTILALHRVYRRMASQEANLHAVDMAAWLIAKYPESAEAHGLRAELAGRLDPTTEVTVSANSR